PTSPRARGSPAPCATATWPMARTATTKGFCVSRIKRTSSGAKNAARRKDESYFAPQPSGDGTPAGPCRGPGGLRQEDERAFPGGLPLALLRGFAQGLRGRNRLERLRGYSGQERRRQRQDAPRRVALPR